MHLGFGPLPQPCPRHFPFASARRTSTSAKKSHPLNSFAKLATVLNQVPALTVRGAFLELHCLVTYNAVQKIGQRAFIVVQLHSLGGSHRLISASPSASALRACGWFDHDL